MMETTPPVPTEDQPLPHLPQAPPQSHTKNVTILALLSVVIILSLAGFLYLIYRNTVTDSSPVITTKSQQPSEKPTPAWLTFTAADNLYSLDYPSDWTVKEFSQGKGASFRPSALPDEPENQVIYIRRVQKTLTETNEESFEAYVRMAGAKEIQNYQELKTITPLLTKSGIPGFTTTWVMAPLTGNQKGTSLPRTYFELEGDPTATLQLVLDDEAYQDIYLQMVSSLTMPKKPKPVAAREGRYVSTALGVSFSTPLGIGTKPFIVSEQDQTICVSQVANDALCGSGQFVEIFQKEAAETLESAIRRLFLAGKDEERCLVTVSNAKNYPAEFLMGQITFPPTEEVDMEQMMLDSEYCSPSYAQTNGIRYFLEDTNKPTRFAFFSIGQYAISSLAQKPWQETFEFE
jgi:hypothetical protein